MASSVEIANMALSHLGTGKEIASFTENSAEANACRRFYDTALDKTLRGSNWPFATRFQTLNLITVDPNEEWLFSYRYPTDCLQAIRIISGIKNEAKQDRIDYRIVNQTTGQEIYTDRENAILEYTVAVTDVNLFPSDFKMALSFLLAHYIAPRVTKGDPFGMGKRAMESYFIEISDAKANAYNEEQPADLPQSEFVRTRE